MSNVLSEEKKKQVIALRQLGRSLRHNQKHTGLRREKVDEYLKAAGVWCVRWAVAARMRRENRPTR